MYGCLKSVPSRGVVEDAQDDKSVMKVQPYYAPGNAETVIHGRLRRFSHTTCDGSWGMCRICFTQNYYMLRSARTVIMMVQLVQASSA